MEVTLEAGDVDVSDLTIDVARKASTHGFDFFSYLRLGSVLSAFEKHLPEDVGDTRRLEGVLTRTSVDVDADAAFYNQKRLLNMLIRNKFRLTWRFVK